MCTPEQKLPAEMAPLALFCGFLDVSFAPKDHTQHVVACVVDGASMPDFQMTVKFYQLDKAVRSIRVRALSLVPSDLPKLVPHLQRLPGYNPSFAATVSGLAAQRLPPAEVMSNTAFPRPPLWVSCYCARPSKTTVTATAGENKTSAAGSSAEGAAAAATTTGAEDTSGGSSRGGAGAGTAEGSSGKSSQRSKEADRKETGPAAAGGAGGAASSAHLKKCKKPRAACLKCAKQPARKKCSGCLAPYCSREW